MKIKSEPEGDQAEPGQESQTLREHIFPFQFFNRVGLDTSKLTGPVVLDIPDHWISGEICSKEI